MEIGVILLVFYIIIFGKGKRLHVGFKALFNKSCNMFLNIKIRRDNHKIDTKYLMARICSGVDRH